jgi:xanthine dehydrogenase accessory factor
VESSLGPLLPLFERERAAGNALAVGLLVHTAGSTYRKPGALMLIAANGDYSGLLSGGCLEGDLRDHAKSVIETGKPRIVKYDMRGPDDLIWGLGLGCEGAMNILLFRVGPEHDWQPLTHLAKSLATYSRTAVAVVVESSDPNLPVGTLTLPSEASSEVRELLAGAARSGKVDWLELPAAKIFALPLTLPPRLLLLGAGPDAAPVVEFATRLGWKVTLVDHRAAYAQADHFPTAEKVIQARPTELKTATDLEHFSAAVVMSHHLPSDLEYLRSLASSPIPYLGLLGPGVRRDKLLGDLGATAQLLRPRLHAPVGLVLGGRTPESIALAIVSEIHAFVHLGNEGPRRAGSAAWGVAPTPPPATAAREPAPARKENA